MNTTTSTEEIYEIGFSESTRAGIELLASDPDLILLRAQAEMLSQDLAATNTRIDRLEYLRANPDPIELTDEQWMSIAGPIALKAAQEAAMAVTACLNRE